MEHYKFESIRFNSRKTYLDAIYILTLMSSNRLVSRRPFTSLKRLSNKIIIQHNPGYKHDKGEKVKCSASDCSHSHVTACSHALKHNYNHILVLEDDYLLEETFFQLRHINEVLRWIKTNNDWDHYFLGCTPFFAIPTSILLDHWRVLLGGCTHALIYSRRGMIKIQDTWLHNYDHLIPIDLNIFRHNKCYMYKSPLITQTLPPTINQTTQWGTGVTGTISLFIIKALSLFERTQPGFDIIYTITKLLTPLIIIFLIVMYKFKMVN